MAMLTDLAPYLVFLHGLSGSGKGEMHRELTQQCEAHGYALHYASSGDLFRAASADPTIAQLMREGRFIDTLGAIMPALEATVERFVVAWLASAGRVLLVLDGVIRSDAFVNAVGEHIPSQIQQIAAGMFAAMSRVLQGEHADRARAWFGAIADSGAESGIAQCEDLIRAAVHVLLDVRPADADHQMQQRALKELRHLHEQLNAGTALAVLPPIDQHHLQEAVAKLDDLVRGNIVERAEDEDVVFTFTEADGTVPDILPRRIDDGVTRLRKWLAAASDCSVEASFADSFRAKGLDTKLRDDDVSPMGRSSRIRKFIRVEEGPGGPHYFPGDAAQALIKGLCFTFGADGLFASTADNCIVIPNGASKGIDLEDLRRACGRQAKTIVEQAERCRALLVSADEYSST